MPIALQKIRREVKRWRGTAREGKKLGYGAVTPRGHDRAFPLPPAEREGEAEEAGGLEDSRPEGPARAESPRLD